MHHAIPNRRRTFLIGFFPPGTTPKKWTNRWIQGEQRERRLAQGHKESWSFENPFYVLWARQNLGEGVIPFTNPTDGTHTRKTRTSKPGCWALLLSQTHPGVSWTSSAMSSFPLPHSLLSSPTLVRRDPFVIKLARNSVGPVGLNPLARRHKQSLSSHFLREELIAEVLWIKLGGNSPAWVWIGWCDPLFAAIHCNSLEPCSEPRPSGLCCRNVLSLCK